MPSYLLNPDIFFKKPLNNQGHDHGQDRVLEVFELPMDKNLPGEDQRAVRADKKNRDEIERVKQREKDLGNIVGG